VTAEATENTEDATLAREFDLDRPVVLHALTFLDEGEEWTVGRPDTDEYCVLPADGAALLKELAGGSAPSAAARWYAETYGETVDMAEFLAAMDELEFIAPEGQAPVGGSGPVRWQRLGRAVFSVPAWIGYAALLGAAGTAMARHHELVPHYQNLFFTRYLTVVLLVGFFGQFPLILLHESFHILAGRRLGLRSRLGIGRRLYFVVVETSMPGLVAVPRRKRYLPILAGMLADLLVIAALTLLAGATLRPDGSLPLFGATCLAMAFAVVPRFLWQFYFYLQTDLYLVVVTVLGCVDLQRTARRTVANRVNRLLGRLDKVADESRWHPRDRAVARWYSWLLVAGYGFSTGTLLVIGLPTVWKAFSTAWHHLDAGLVAVADSLVFVVITLGQLVFAGVLALRQRRQRRQRQAAATPTHVID
jgi:hypothetical protein